MKAPPDAYESIEVMADRTFIVLEPTDPAFFLEEFFDQLAQPRNGRVRVVTELERDRLGKRHAVGSDLFERA